MLCYVEIWNADVEFLIYYFENYCDSAQSLNWDSKRWMNLEFKPTLLNQINNIEERIEEDHIELAIY